jgi:hypothetical protein
MKSKFRLIALVEFLETREAILLGLILSLSTQLWHSVTAFVELEKNGPELLKYAFGLAFAFSNSFAILMFTLRGSKIAYFFLAVEIFINIIHYKVMDLDFRENLSFYISTLFMSIIVPVTISQYSRASRKVVAENQESPAAVKKEVPVPVQDTPKLPFRVPVKPNVIETFDMDSLLKEINKRIGFDITNKKETSENLSEEKVKALRAVWKKHKSLSKDEILDKIDGILKAEGEPLFA